LSAPRVGLIGARRARRGLGPYVARDLLAAGAEVPCFLGTSDQTVERARVELESTVGLSSRGYVDLEEMLSRERLDALAVLSPADTHEAYLRAAIRAGLHVLCEKPLVWGGEGLGKRAGDLVAAFASRGLLLAENCQWPYVLPAYRDLHPDLAPGPPASFSMQLSPEVRGREMVGESMSHPLSLLQTVASGGDAHLEQVRVSAPGAGSGEPDHLEFRGRYRAGGAEIGFEVALVRTTVTPKPAALALDGRWAHREVDLPSYAIHLNSGVRRVKVVDPLTSRVRDFVEELGRVLGGRAPGRFEEIAVRMAMLEEVRLATERGMPR